MNQNFNFGVTDLNCKMVHWGCNSTNVYCIVSKSLDFARPLLDLPPILDSATGSCALVKQRWYERMGARAGGPMVVRRGWRVDGVVRRQRWGREGGAAAGAGREVGAAPSARREGEANA